MKAMRYRNMELERLEWDEFISMNTKAVEGKTSKELMDILLQYEDVYLWYYCDDEFVNKYPTLKYFK